MKQLLSITLCLSLTLAPVSMAQASGGGKSMAQQILGISNGVMGSVIIMKCKLGMTQPSLPVYMAGGIVYILGEITGGKKKSSDMQSNSKKLDDLKSTMTEGGDYQKAAVDMQIADEKSNLEFVQKRRKWMMALKAIYGVATGLAVTEMFMALPPVFKPDIAGCAPDGFTHLGPTSLVAAAYAGAASSGSVTGAATAVAVQAAIEHFSIELLSGTTVADLGIAILNPAVGRIAYFGATTAIAFKVDSELQAEETRIKKNLATLEKVKAQFDASSNAIAEGSTNLPGAEEVGGAKIKDPTKGQYALTTLPKATELPKTCYSQSAKGEVLYSPTACNNAVKIPRPTFDSRFDIPALQAGANTSVDLAQAIASGDMAKAELEAGKLAAMAGNIEKIKDDLLKKANERLASEGKKPIDINGEVNRQLAALGNGANGAQSSSGSSVANTTNTDSAKVSESNKSEVDKTNLIGGSEVKSAAVPGAPGIDLSGIGAGEAGGTSVEEAGKDSRLASLDESLEQYEDSQSDIAKDPGVSIFKQVSNRYFLNYNKIFNRKEITPPLATPTK